MKLSLSKINFLNILFTAITFSVIIGFFSINIINTAYEEKIEQLEKNYIKRNKLLVKDEVHRAIKRINTLEQLAYNSLKENLEEKVDLVYNVFSYNQNFSKEEIIKKYKKELDTFKWDNKSGYFYIFDNKGIILYHGANSSLEKRNIFELVKDNKELKNFIKDTMTKEKNFGSYKWYKPNEKIDQIYKKYVFAKKLDKYNIYIAAGIYKNEFEKKVQNIVLDELKKERFGEEQYGYFWAHNLQNKMLMHPLKKELLNIDLSKFQSEDGQYLFIKMNELALKKGSGYVSYKWQKPNTNIIDEKISYVYLIKKWDIVIGSGFYLTELKSMLKDEKQSLKKSLANNLKEIYTIITILLFLSLIIAWIISKKIKKVEIAQKEHLNMLEQYQLILDKSAVVSKTDTNGIIRYSNDNFAKVSGYSKNELIGKSHSIVKHQDTPKSQFKKLWRNIENGKIWKGIIKNKRKDGTSYFNSTTIVPIKDPNGNILEYISSSFDVTELFENRTKLQNIFKTDQLTGLGNRISLLDKINENSKGVLALINIDRFKEVNDIHGHEIGDTIIKNLGERLFKFIEEEDYTLFRLQADVFALFTKNKLETVVEKIEDFIDKEGFKPYKIEQNSFTLSYSCGIAADTENFLAYADMALSEAKNKKIRIKVYDDSMKNISQYKHNILWVEKLHTALAEDRIVPYFQPIYNYHTQKIEKYECLMRLIEDGNIIPPSEYLDIAKKTKLYPKLTYKIAAKSINKFANTDKEFSINLSIEDLMNEKLMNFLFDYAEQKDIFNKMVLEIVESEEIEDCEQISTMVKKFKEKGTKVAIDDFGSGYSNYEYLISLQADYIKIDGSITKLILEDKRTEDVVKSIVNFAKKSNMKTIAEFVSSKELDSKLKELGVDYAQGWYYGKAEKELL